MKIGNKKIYFNEQKLVSLLMTIGLVLFSMAFVLRLAVSFQAFNIMMYVFFGYIALSLVLYLVLPSKNKGDEL